MTKDQANAIELRKILEKLGCQPVKQKDGDIWYNSPLCKDASGSFQINAFFNDWFDYAVAKGGHTLDFVCLFLEKQGEDHTEKDALRWLDNMQLFDHEETNVVKLPMPDVSALKVVKNSPLKFTALIRELEERGITAPVAKKHLRELELYNENTETSFLAVGFSNENDGYEYRNRFSKGYIGPKYISFIRGSLELSQEVHVFEEFLDYLSALHHEKDNHFEGDVIILNSVKCVPLAFTFIRSFGGYKTIYSWLDNDVAGRHATKELQELNDKHTKLAFRPKNELYAPYKDVNAWHMQKK